jgi:hypothetical protein
MREMSYVPEHNILLLDTLIVFVISKLAAGPKAPGYILAHVGATNGHVEIGKLVSLAIVL